MRGLASKIGRMTEDFILKILTSHKLSKKKGGKNRDKRMEVRGDIRNLCDLVQGFSFLELGYRC